LPNLAAAVDGAKSRAAPEQPVTPAFAICNKTHGFFHQNIMCRKTISAKRGNYISLMVSTGILNVLKLALSPTMLIILISSHWNKAEIRPCENILCSKDISEKDAKFGSLMENTRV